jgi:octaprenyl-diphosphate synthase
MVWDMKILRIIASMSLKLDDIKKPIATEMEDFEQKFRASMKTKVLLLDKIMGA